MKLEESGRERFHGFTKVPLCVHVPFTSNSGQLRTVEVVDEGSGEERRLDEGVMTIDPQAFAQVERDGTHPPEFAMSASDLHLGFGRKTVLEDINLDIESKRITALVGPSGSGKTTFLRSLNRMNDKVSGAWMRGA